MSPTPWHSWLPSLILSLSFEDRNKVLMFKQWITISHHFSIPSGNMWASEKEYLIFGKQREQSEFLNLLNVIKCRSFYFYQISSKSLKSLSLNSRDMGHRSRKKALVSIFRLFNLVPKYVWFPLLISSINCNIRGKNQKRECLQSANKGEETAWQY